MAAFLKLLPEEPDEGTMNCLLRHFAQQVAVADTPQAATAVFNSALAMPHSETRVKALKQAHISINGRFQFCLVCRVVPLRFHLDVLPNIFLYCTGLFQTNVISRSLFLYAFDSKSLTPYLLKVPYQKNASSAEFQAWSELAPTGEPKDFNLAGPLRLLELEVRAYLTRSFSFSHKVYHSLIGIN